MSTNVFSPDEQKHQVNWRRELARNLDFFENEYDTCTETLIETKPGPISTEKLIIRLHQIANSDIAGTPVALTAEEEATVQEYIAKRQREAEESRQQPRTKSAWETWEEGGKVGPDPDQKQFYEFRLRYQVSGEERAAMIKELKARGIFQYLDFHDEGAERVTGHKTGKPNGTSCFDDDLDEPPASDDPPDLDEERRTENTPLDIWGDSFVLPELTKDMLPKVIADFAWDEADRIGFDPACIAIPCLMVCAAALHDDIKIQPMRNNTGWTESARLWGGFMAPPSGRKTVAFQSATRPVKEVEKKWREEDMKALAKYLHDLEDWKDACRRARKKGMEPPEEPEKPSMRRLYTSDFTMEALEEILDENERGILIYNDELIGFIAGLDAYKTNKGKDRSAALQLYNGDALPVDRKGNHRLIPNWSACVTGGIQDDKLKQIANGLSLDGMLQRFLLFRAGVPGLGMDRKPNMDALIEYDTLYRTLLNQCEDRVVKLSEDAHAYREEAFELADALANDPSLSSAFRTHVGKIPGMFARLLLTLHAIQSCPDPIGREVNAETARMARDLMVKFFIPHELAIYADLFDHTYEVGEDMRWIADHILTHKLDSFTDRDIYRAKREFMQDRKHRRLENALRGLGELGWITVERTATGKTANIVNARVHSLFAERAKQAEHARAAIRARVGESARFRAKRLAA